MRASAGDLSKAQTSAQLWSALVETFPGFVTVVNRAHDIVHINKTVFDLAREDVIGRSVYDFVEPDYHDEARRCIDAVFGGSLSECFRSRAGSPDNGKYRWFENQLAPVKIEDRIVGVALVAQDVTDRVATDEQLQQATINMEREIAGRTAELVHTNALLTKRVDELATVRESLQQREGILSALIGAMDDIVYTIDHQQRCVGVFGSWPALLGLKQERFLGKTPAEIFSAEQAKPHQQAFARALRGERVVYDWDLETPDGKTRRIHTALSPMRSTDGKIDGLVAVGREVTALMQLEATLARSNKFEALTTLADGMAHDFNNVLAIVGGNLELLALNAVGDDRELIADARDATRRAVGLAQSLRFFSKGGEPQRTPTNVGHLTRDAVELSLHGSEVKAQFAIDDDLHFALIDPALFAQAIQSLARNAVDAMPAGGTLRVTAQNAQLSRSDATSVLTPGPHVRIRISDQGHGIAPRDRERIFDPFFSKKEQHKGLGLTVAYMIATRQNGNLSLVESSSAGSTFELLLPATNERPAEEFDQLQVVPTGSESILVMEDEVLLRILMWRTLKGLGYRVETVADAESTLERYDAALKKNEPFDLVLLDLTVASGEGAKAVLRRLQALNPAVRGIVTSGYADADVITDPRKFGFAGALTKPLGREAIATEVRRVLDLPTSD
ncbi:MAG: PAS domain S-box protein [Deltaproteobacteria bacterium]|nr:PAS domain S-box protein [Deltaproteobacteria bacterium]